MKSRAMILCAGILLCGPVAAGQLEVTVHKLTNSGVAEEIGTIAAKDTDYGVIFAPDLRGVAEGLHGFHVHENPDCGAAGKDGKMTAGAAAGSHLDPDNTGKHLGPYEQGHLGDLPALYADASGKVTHPVLAPKIKTTDLKGRALIVHEGGDNYQTQPELGGGGDRIACAVVEG